MQLLIGADPEAFLRNEKGFVSAYGLVPGSKEKPYPVDRGAVQPDGLAAEWNIEPAANKQTFVMNLNTVLDQLREMVPGHQVVFSATADFSEEYMRKVPKEAKRLGCSPDFSAYEECANPAPAEHPTMRAAGGHIHLGWTNDREPMDIAHFKSCCTAIKYMDYFLGVPSVLMDSDSRRKEMYGKAGAFRPKSYGAEYRTLSNFWVASNGLMEWAYEQTMDAFDCLVNQTRDLIGEFGDLAQAIINSNDKDRAKSLCQELGLRLA